jgi:hypothetical protein
VANLTTVWGGEDIALTEQQVQVYQRHLDGFVAKHFGLTREEYREWIESDGTALCGGKTKAGKPCGNILTRGFQLDAQKWKARHRSEYCKIYGGE